VAAVTGFTYMKKPKTVAATPEQLVAALDYIEPLVPESIYNIFAGLVQTYLSIVLKFEQSKVTITWLRHWIFGSTTEKRNASQKSTDTAVAQSELGDKKSSKSDTDSAADHNESGEPKIEADSNKPKKRGTDIIL
jgi:hypothetical protein